MPKFNPVKARQSYMQRMEGSLKDKGVTLFEPDNNSLHINSDNLSLPAQITELTANNLVNTSMLSLNKRCICVL